jgi:thioredoxin reductase (NADPH)
MAPVVIPVDESRREQMFPTLDGGDMARLRRFGTPRLYAAGEPLVRVGDPGHGLTLIVAGKVAVSGRDRSGGPRPIVTHGPGSFMGELAQLSGRPSLVDAVANEAVEAVVIAPDRLRALLVAEAEMGERIMRALILRRVGLIQSGGGGPVVIGAAGDAGVLRLQGFLARNAHPYQQLDPEEDSCAATLVARFDIGPDELPIVLCPGGQLLRRPDEAMLARCLGLLRPIDPERLYDVAVVGAGPAGLATAVYAASEGLSVLALDCRSFGGQAGASARIENYLGFPTGVSGIALMARAFNQAQKFGVETAIPDEAVRLECDEPGTGVHRLTLANGERIRARAVVVATGARYRRLSVERIEELEGTTVHYWASPLEARLAAAEEVALVGGGNSAGQAAVFLAGHARRVTLLARRPLQQTMSAYLVERIAGVANIEVVSGVEVCALEGERGALRAIEWCDRVGGRSRREVRQLFLFIGADPNTDWLRPSGLLLDPGGFVRTGAEAGEDRLPLETSRPGVFAVGDVRSGSVKRVASSVGDGAQVVASIHAFLARAGAPAAPVPLTAQIYAH